MKPEVASPSSNEEIIELVKSRTSIIPRGGGTKPSLWYAPDSTTIVDTGNIKGIVEYQPSEYTITVKSGTKLNEIVDTLAENGQYLPFDPPLAPEGATIGGSVAAGLSGPGAYRYGPLKDFIIGVRFIDGLGDQIRGGGKVVKNAAGFDFPKIFNGSLGRLGILTELSFKVFPEPKTYVTLQVRLDSLEEAAQVLPTLKGFDLEGVEVSAEMVLSLRLGYQEPTMNARKDALEALIGKPLQIILGEEEPLIWNGIKSFAWLDSGNSLFKTATTPASVWTLLKSLDAEIWQTHSTNGGKTLYLGAKDGFNFEVLESTLKAYNLTGLQLRGPVRSHPLVGNRTGLSFVARVQSALDPNGVFQPFKPSNPDSA